MEALAQRSLPGVNDRPPIPGPLFDRDLLPIEPLAELEPVVAEPADGATGLGRRWDLETLGRLVETRGADFPEHADEWAYYLLYLRDFTDSDGVLPESFDDLVSDVFRPLLEEAPRA